MRDMIVPDGNGVVRGEIEEFSNKCTVRSRATCPTWKFLRSVMGLSDIMSLSRKSRKL